MERNVTIIFLCRERSATGLVNITSRGTKRMRPAGRYVQARRLPPSGGRT
jgi:hypothetical protein